MRIKKKRLLSLSIVSAIFFSFLCVPTVTQASFYKATGNISWYDGEGKMGYDGKILTKLDCATKQSVDNPKAGTVIYVNDDTTGTSRTFYKYDVGNFPKGVVLDLTYSGWMTFGHKASDGYFAGRYFHS